MMMKRNSNGTTGLSAVTMIRFVFIALMCLFAIIPILWAISTSLKTIVEISSYPPTFIPKIVTAQNYLQGVFRPKFLRYLANTVMVFCMACVLSILLASHAAYAMSRMRFLGKNLMMTVMFSTIMIPGVAIIVPLYLASVRVGLYDTHLVLVIVYSSWLIPTLIWLLRGFVTTIPRDLEEAALIDGCNRRSAFYRIVFPLMRPGLVAGAVFLFCNIWNEFLIGYCLVQADTSRLVQVGIYFFITENSIDWGGLTAGAITASIPIFIAYAILQRAFIQGLSGGAVKG
jgi:multiple sugar transport system permease protein